MELKELLLNKLNTKVRFTFKKKNGELREVYATRNLDFIPEDKRPKNTIVNEEKEGHIRFFDLEKNDWRSCNASQVAEIL